MSTTCPLLWILIQAYFSLNARQTERNEGFMVSCASLEKKPILSPQKSTTSKRRESIVFPPFPSLPLPSPPLRHLHERKKWKICFRAQLNFDWFEQGTNLECTEPTMLFPFLNHNQTRICQKTKPTQGVQVSVLFLPEQQHTCIL